MYESLYGSAWHHPGIAWASALVMWVVIARKLPFFWAYLVSVLFITSADAMITGGFSKLGGESFSGYPLLSFVFILFGDWRCYLLTERYSRGASRSAWWRSFWMAMAPTLIVLVMDQIFVGVFDTKSRVMFLIYEMIFICIAFTYGALVMLPRLAGVDVEVARWLKWVFGFQLCGYALWVACDLLILAGYDVGLALRIVPNAMYYAGFLPVVYLTVPKKERSWLKA